MGGLGLGGYMDIGLWSQVERQSMPVGEDSQEFSSSISVFSRS